MGKDIYADERIRVDFASDGTVNIRDTAGKIITTALSPERRQSMSEGMKKHHLNSDELVEALLNEAGYTEENVPVHLLLLARFAVVDGSLKALQTFLESTGITHTSTPPEPMSPNGSANLKELLQQLEQSITTKGEVDYASQSDTGEEAEGKRNERKPRIRTSQ